MPIIKHAYPVIISAIHIPFDVIARSFRCEGFESVRICDLRSLFVGEFLVFFVVPMIGIDLFKSK
jgi:hypothetical protein